MLLGNFILLLLDKKILHITRLKYPTNCNFKQMPSTLVMTTILKVKTVLFNSDLNAENCLSVCLLSNIGRNFQNTTILVVITLLAFI